VKKRLITFLLVSIMALSFTVPIMATTNVAAETIKDATYQEIVPFTQMTRIYHRFNNGRLQFRVWGITSGRWLTDWAYM
jgi:hypothetical protein